MSPLCRMKRSTALGSFFLPLISVITEISEVTDRMSSVVAATSKKVPLAWERFGPAGVLHGQAGFDGSERTAKEGLVRERTQFPSSRRRCRGLRALYDQPH